MEANFYFAVVLAAPVACFLAMALRRAPKKGGAEPTKRADPAKPDDGAVKHAIEISKIGF